MNTEVNQSFFKSKPTFYRRQTKKGSYLTPKKLRNDASLELSALKLKEKQKSRYFAATNNDLELYESSDLIINLKNIRRQNVKM
jgi:hypothetical protein